MLSKIELLKELYFHELERKKSLEGMFALPTGIIAGLFGLVGYYFSKFNFGLSGKAQVALEYCFIGSATVSVLLLLLSTFWCSRAVIGSEYEHLPGAETMMNYWNDLKSWHNGNARSGAEARANADFEDFLSTALSRCCQKNWRSNLYRSEELYRANRSIVWALFAIAFLSICYYINFSIAPTTLKP